MYARFSTFEADAAAMQRFAAKFEEIRPRIGAIPGLVDLYLVLNDHGGVVAAIYQTRAAADAARTGFAQAAWAVLEGLYRDLRIEHYDTVMHFPGAGRALAADPEG